MNHDTQKFLPLSTLLLLLLCLLFSLTVQFHFFFLLPLLLLQCVSHHPFFSFSLPLFSILLMSLFIPGVSLLMNWLADFFSLDAPGWSIPCSQLSSVCSQGLHAECQQAICKKNTILFYVLYRLEHGKCKEVPGVCQFLCHSLKYQQNDFWNWFDDAHTLFIQKFLKLTLFWA